MESTYLGGAPRPEVGLGQSRKKEEVGGGLGCGNELEQKNGKKIRGGSAEMMWAKAKTGAWDSEH